MSGFISSLLAKEKNTLRTTLDKLELASGESSIDSKLISELIIKSQSKLKELGLDSKDTTAQELHVSLVNLLALHDKFLAKALGGTDPSDLKDMVPRMAKYSNDIAKKQTVWVVKHSVAKKIIKQLPPKVLMKKLGYRSIDSMLKRESIDDLYAGLRITENPDYLNKFFSLFKNLIPSDFESRKLIVKNLNTKKWAKVSNDYVNNQKNNILSLKELGSVIVFPIPIDNLKGATILILPIILNKLNELQLYSSYYKFEQVKHEFGQIFTDSLLNKPPIRVTMAGIDLSWGIIRDHFSKLVKNGSTDVFEPHVQSEDLTNSSVEESLYQLEPALHFWHGCNCLGVPYKDGSISFNIMDIATDYTNNLSYGSNSTSFLNNSLWDELLSRYLSSEPLQEQVLQQLDNQSVSDDFHDVDVLGAQFA